MVFVAQQTERIDLFLEKCLPLKSRKKIRQMFDCGEVFVNEKRIWLAKFQVRKGDRVVVLQVERAERKLQRESILYENEDFLVLNKPAGLVVESGTGTFPVLKELEKLGYHGLELVHRLDKETSGVLLLAKNSATRQQLVANWAKVHKTYLAICCGRCAEPHGVINTPIPYHSSVKHPWHPGIVHSYRSARTRYRVIAYAREENLSLLECVPQTGRTHQIRVHLASIHRPILGDKLYGGNCSSYSLSKQVPRQLLHAYRIQFRLHSRAYVLKGPLPQDFRKLLGLFTPLNC